MPMVRTDSPSTLFLFFQNPMSFLKAKKSKTECSSETKKVRPRKIGLPSSRTLFSSSDSPSAMAPHDCYTHIHRRLLRMHTQTAAGGKMLFRPLGQLTAGQSMVAHVCPVSCRMLLYWRLDAHCYNMGKCTGVHRQEEAYLMTNQVLSWANNDI